MSQHSDLIRFLLDLSKQPPFAGRVHLYKQQTGVSKRGGAHISYGKKGYADVMGFTSLGLIVAAEIKVGKDKLNPDQIKFRDLVLSVGGHWAEIRSEKQAYEFLLEVTRLSTATTIIP